MTQPWQGPYRILQRNDPDITASKVYFPGDGQIQVHQQRVTRCPSELIAGYYWYGPKKRSSGRTPQWVKSLCVPSGVDQYMDDDIGSIESTDDDGQSPPEGDNDKDRNMENDVENRESTDTEGQSRPEGDDDMLRARNEMEDNQVSESLGPTTTASQTESQQRASNACPYTLRKKVQPPRRYQ